MGLPASNSVWQGSFTVCSSQVLIAYTGKRAFHAGKMIDWTLSLSIELPTENGI